MLEAEAAEVHAFLDQAKEKFHAHFGRLANGRTQQFDSALSTVKMAVDHSADELPKQDEETK
jgi:hypothetical protein